MASSTNRITGLASGMDIDSIIEATMDSYKTKVNKKKQEKEILEIRQQLYRDLIKDGQDFYNKYFNLGKSDSLLASKNYVSTTFTSKDESVVTATGLSTAVKDNYTVKVDQLAEVAKTSISGSALTGDIEIKSKSGSVLIKESELSGKTEREKAEIINSKIKSIGMKASVSDFRSGITFETTDTGSQAEFTITTGGTIIPETVNGTTTTEVTKNFTIDELNNIDKDLMFTAGDKKVIIRKEDITNSVKSINDRISELEAKIQDDTQTEDDKEILRKEIDELVEERGRVYSSTLKSRLSSVGLDAELSQDGSEIVIKSTTDGESFKLTMGTYEAAKLDTSASRASNSYTVTGKDLIATVKKSTGETIEFGTGSADARTSSSNNVTLDGVMFTMSGVGETKIVGKTDGSALKDKIKSFVEDYNNLVKTLNKYTTENKNRDYQPLTEDQKKEMTEDEIKKWNEKVKQGQLKGDSDLNRILSSLKSSLYIVEGCVSLSSIGITLSTEYGSTKAGTLELDEEKLLAAIEEDPEAIMDLFIKKGDKPGNTGILYRMKEVLDNEFVSTTKSALINKAGLEGTTSFTQSTLSKQIKEYSKKISQMEEDLKKKEQALYSKWASVETAMNKLNSQLSNLQSYFA